MTNSEIIHIDGSQGEGGGQILRSSLALSMITGRPVHLHDIRAGRAKPGLMRQHLTCVRAAREVCGGAVTGDQIGSREVTLWPDAIRAGDFELSVGSAGSTGLVLQAILPALAFAPGRSTVTLRGGTHNPTAPPFDFLQRAFLPLVRRMGLGIEAQLVRPGFYPAGGGCVELQVTPAKQPLRPLELLDRGRVVRRAVEARVSSLPLRIARTEIDTVCRALGWNADLGRAVSIAEPRGPGNVVVVDVETESATEVFSGFGERGVRAETVGRRLAGQVRRFIDADVPVGPHLADQLLLWLALAGGGAFRTVEPTLHTQTHKDIIGRFLDVDVSIDRQDGAWLVQVAS